MLNSRWPAIFLPLGVIMITWSNLTLAEPVMLKCSGEGKRPVYIAEGVWQNWTFTMDCYAHFDKENGRPLSNNTCDVINYTSRFISSPTEYQWINPGIRFVVDRRTGAGKVSRKRDPVVTFDIYCQLVTEKPAF